MESQDVNGKEAEVVLGARRDKGMEMLTSRRVAE